jgi:hypothetical protein
MVRGLYRFYLYVVFFAMVIFAAIGVQGFLQTLLGQTALNGDNPAPSSSQLVQSLVFGVVALAIAMVFGGLHYWLIRRDMRGDPQAGNQAIRAFFLNAVALVALTSAVGIGASALGSLGQRYSGGVSGTMAYSIAFLAAWALIELERRRVPADAGVAVVFQRLHVHGAQLILFILIAFNWLTSIGQLVDALFFHGRGSPPPTCFGFIVCTGPNLLSELAGLLLLLAFWIGYLVFARNESNALLPRVLYLISFGLAFIFVLLAIYRGAYLLFSTPFSVSIDPHTISGPNAPYDGISPFSLGLLASTLYILRLLLPVRKQPSSISAITLTLHAIVTGLASAAFWWGIGLFLLNLLEFTLPSGRALAASDWVNALALLTSGVLYIPLDIFLRYRSSHANVATPLRGLAFVLLGAGIVTGAIGLATTLYAFGTSLLGSPLASWQFIAHSGIAASFVGIILVVIYLWTSRNQRFLNAPAPPSPQPPPTPAILPSSLSTASTAAVSDIIDALLAGNITRDEAIKRLASLDVPQV